MSSDEDHQKPVDEAHRRQLKIRVGPVPIEGDEQLVIMTLECLAETLTQIGMVEDAVWGAGASVVDKARGILTAAMGAFRWQNFLKVAQMATSLLPRGTSRQMQLPARTGLALVEGASRESDSAMQNLWAHLIADSINASGNTAHQGVNRQLADTLSAMSPLDAAVLSCVAERSTMVQVAGAGGAGTERRGREFPGVVSMAVVQEMQEVDPSDIFFSVSELTRLGLLQVETMPKSDGVNAPVMEGVLASFKAVGLSSRGYRLLKTCGVEVAAPVREFWDQVSSTEVGMVRLMQTIVLT